MAEDYFLEWKIQVKKFNRKRGHLLKVLRKSSNKMRSENKTKIYFIIFKMPSQL